MLPYNTKQGNIYYASHWSIIGGYVKSVIFGIEFSQPIRYMAGSHVHILLSR